MRNKNSCQICRIVISCQATPLQKVLEMPLNLGDTFPNLDVDTSVGRIQLHDYFGDSWGVLFSHPADFTPVCTTELGQVAKLIPEFSSRNTKVIALSCDPVDKHKSWIADIKAYSNTTQFTYPIISDADRSIAIQLGMVDPVDKDAAGLPLTCRAVFVISPDRKLKLSLLYPATTGRNFDEILRVIDSLQLTAYKRVATPANWQKGDKVMILPNVSKADADKLFPGYTVQAVPSGKEYIRLADQPK